MNRHLAILLATLFVSVRVAAQVTLTEFLTANTRGLRDENLEFSDWIEIRNEGSTPVNLLDWTLTDDPARPDLWSLPSTNLPAGGFLLVFASGKDRSLAGRELHAERTGPWREGSCMRRSRFPLRAAIWRFSRPSRRWRRPNTWTIRSRRRTCRSGLWRKGATSSTRRRRAP
jgi:hypothetical protein